MVQQVFHELAQVAGDDVAQAVFARETFIRRDAVLEAIRPDFLGAVAGADLALAGGGAVAFSSSTRRNPSLPPFGASSGAWNSWVCASLSMRPQLGMGGCVPRPR